MPNTANTEIAVESRLHELTLNGRIDRIDHGPDGAGIVDYKTGATPHQKDVLSGEEVQLPFYALLTPEPTRQVEYLSLDGNSFGSRASLEGETLHTLVAQNAERLGTVMGQISNGAPLPAWGDDDTCRFCAMAGICRRESWTPE